MKINHNSSIKEWPELRHVLAHFDLALRALAEGSAAECSYELDQIRSQIFFDSDECQTKLARKIYNGL